MRGSGFGILRNGALGKISYDNDAPLSFRYDNQDTHTFDVEVISNTEAVLRYRQTAAPSPYNYLGCIVSFDGSVVYWVNETRPLP